VVRPPVGGCRPPRWQARASALPVPTIQHCSSGTCTCPCYQQIARAGHAPCEEARWKFSATTPSPVRSRDLGIGSSAQKRFFCQVLTQSRVPRDRAGNGIRPADILWKAWDERWDLAVDLTIVHPNPVLGRPLRGSAATFLEDKGEQKCRESADSCGRLGVDFSPMVFDTWWGLHGAGKGVVRAMFTRCPTPARRPPCSGGGPEAGPQRLARPLSGPAAGGLDDEVDGGAGMVSGRPAGHPRPHGGGQPAVVSPQAGGKEVKIPALASIVSPLIYCSYLLPSYSLVLI